MFTGLTRIALALLISTAAGCVYYDDDYGRYGHDDERYEHQRHADRDCDDDHDYDRRGCWRGENDQGEDEQ